MHRKVTFPFIKLIKKLMLISFSLMVVAACMLEIRKKIRIRLRIRQLIRNEEKIILIRIHCTKKWFRRANQRIRILIPGLKYIMLENSKFTTIINLSSLLQRLGGNGRGKKSPPPFFRLHINFSPSSSPP